MRVGPAILLLIAGGWGRAEEEQPTRVVSMYYPCLALKARTQGTVHAQCAIANDGLCSEVKAISGHPLLLKNAMDNLRKWRYSRSARLSQTTRPTRLAVVQYRFIIGAATKSTYEPDAVVTFDPPDIVRFPGSCSNLLGKRAATVLSARIYSTSISRCTKTSPRRGSRRRSRSSPQFSSHAMRFPG